MLVSDGVQLVGEPVAASAAAPSTSAASRPRRIGARGVGQSAARRPVAGTKFTGINVNILTFNGPQVAEPLQRRAPDWER